MKLREWLAEREMNNSEFGAKIGRTAEAVRRYTTGDRLPDRGTMLLIVRHTDGKVQPNDFFDVPENLAECRHEDINTDTESKPLAGNNSDLTDPEVCLGGSC